MSRDIKDNNVLKGVRPFRITVMTMLVMAMAIQLSGCTANLSHSEVCGKLEQYTISVYAPKSMEEFEEAKEEAVSLGIMTESVANQFFAAYGDNLTEVDLARRCFASASHSDADMQSNGVEKYLVSASLYNSATGTPIKITIEFNVNADGVIDSYSLVSGV